MRKTALALLASTVLVAGCGGGKSATKATFIAPGEYILRLQANDTTGEGGGGFQCCWTNAQVRISVGAGATNRR